MAALTGNTRRMSPRTPDQPIPGESSSTAPPGQLTTKTVYRNNWMRVREDTFERPDGEIATYGVVDRDDFAVVIAETGGAFYLVEQFRYALGRRSWEFPMGTWPAGHTGSDEALARQELLEETGVSAEHWRRLGNRMAEAPGFCSQGFTVFHATGLTEGQHQREASEADMVSALVAEQDFRAMILDGRIIDGPTIAAYALLRLLS
jgi:8-oxo-dGTP pyrophosphatase MutT (NUDIX family)